MVLQDEFSDLHVLRELRGESNYIECAEIDLVISTAAICTQCVSLLGLRNILCLG